MFVLTKLHRMFKYFCSKRFKRVTIINEHVKYIVTFVYEGCRVDNTRVILMHNCKCDSLFCSVGI